MRVQDVDVPPGRTSPSETTRLVGQLWKGDADAFEQLVERHLVRLHALVRSRMGRDLRQREESRDLLQDVLVRAVRGVEGFRGATPGEWWRWLARVVETTVADRRDHHRAERRDLAREIPLGDREPGEIANGADLPPGFAPRLESITRRLVLDEGLRRLEVAIDDLPPEQREALILRRFEQLSWKEVGERLGRSADACRMLVARAEARLALEMKAT